MCVWIILCGYYHPLREGFWLGCVCLPPNLLTESPVIWTCSASLIIIPLQINGAVRLKHARKGEQSRERWWEWSARKRKNNCPSSVNKEPLESKPVAHFMQNQLTNTFHCTQRFLNQWFPFYRSIIREEEKRGVESVVGDDDARKHRLHLASKPFGRMALWSLQADIHEATLPPHPTPSSHYYHLPPSRNTCFQREMPRNRGKDAQHWSPLTSLSRWKRAEKTAECPTFLSRKCPQSRDERSAVRADSAQLVIVAVQGVRGVVIVEVR